ncbi:MAG: hypothetical protein WC272_10025 [Sulfurimonas sp.]
MDSRSDEIVLQMKTLENELLDELSYFNNTVYLVYDDTGTYSRYFCHCLSECLFSDI